MSIFDKLRYAVLSVWGAYELIRAIIWAFS